MAQEKAAKQRISKKRRLDPVTRRRVPVRNTASATNAKPGRKSFFGAVVASKKLPLAQLDGRSPIGLAEKHLTAELLTQYGQDVTAAQMHMIRSAARLIIVEAIAYADINARGVMIGEDENPAVRVLMKAVRSKASVLSMLGLERKLKPVPDLRTYINNRAERVDDDIEDVES